MGGFEEKAAVINIFDNDHSELIDKYYCWSIKSKFDGDGDSSVGDD